MTQRSGHHIQISQALTGTANLSLPYTKKIPELTCFFVWMTFALSFFVFKEPAPFDFCLVILIWALPLLGLTVRHPVITAYALFWLMITAASLIASTQAHLISEASSHIVITFFLALGSIVLAGFIAKSPLSHSSLIMNGYLVAAVIAASCAIIGYFNLLPFSYDLFTKFGRASGTFKDPNVLGAFLIPAFIYAFAQWSRLSFLKGLFLLGLSMLLAFAVFLSFSRGAWFHLVISFSTFCFLSFVTASSSAFRLRLLALAVAGLILGTGLLTLISQSDTIHSLLQQRASLSQSYDSGPEGRFGGQAKAFDLILEHPAGIGALEFSKFHHREDVHNVYLSMFLNAGWIGGILYIVLIMVTLIYGFQACLKKTGYQPLLLVAFSSFIGLALEGMIIDTDHWRHFFVLLAVLWGLTAASSYTEQTRQ